MNSRRWYARDSVIAEILFVLILWALIFLIGGC